MPRPSKRRQNEVVVIETVINAKSSPLEVVHSGRNSSSTSTPRGRGRGRGKRANQSSKKTSNSTQLTHAVSGKRQSRGRGRGRGRPTAASRQEPAVVDIFILSSDDDESKSSITSSSHTSDLDTDASKENRNGSNESNSPQLTNDVENMESSAQLITDPDKVIPLIGFDPTVTFSDSDSDNDIYSVNHNAIKASAQQAAVRGLHQMQEEQQQLRQRLLNKEKNRTRNENVIVFNVEDSRKRNACSDSPPSSPEISNIRLSARKMIKMSKKTEQILKKAELFSDKSEIDFDQSFNKTLDSDVDLLLLYKEEDNPVIQMKVMYGLEFTKIPIKKHEKFGCAYQKLAEIYKVSFDNVVLNLHDVILSPDQTPADVQLSVADIVDCGIIRKPATENRGPASDDDSSDPNTIKLKLQCSALRGSVFININKFEKMSVVMQKYAQQKGQDVNKFRFMFDGEKLDPSETPVTLDLEGGECIDVFPL